MLILLLFFPAPGAFGQIAGDLKGTVADPAGGAISSALVTLTSQETGEKRARAADGEGRFTFPLLKTGTYEVRAEAAGFRQAVTTAQVRSAETAFVSFRLEVGQVTETVTVTDAVSPLDTENAQIQYSVDSRQTAAVPVARSPIQFALTMPGTAPPPAASAFANIGMYNANGNRGRANNITIDNIVSTDVAVSGVGGAQLGPLNFAELKEVKLITHNFSAEHGRNAGSQLLFITRGGSNEFHGEAYDFLQNDRLNARDFFDPTGRAAVTRYNQFGYTFGGPVARNKTHFFHAYEGVRQRGAGAVRIANVPTPDMLARVADPASKALLEQYRLPAATQVNADAGNVAQSARTYTDSFQFSVRVDHQLGERDTLYARYAHYQATTGSSSNTFIGTNLANFGINAVNGPRNLSLAETHVFAAGLVNEFRAAYGRSSPIFGMDSTVPPGPRITFANGQVSTFGQWEGAPQGRVQNTFQWSDTLSWTRGAHNLKLGADLHRYQGNSFLDSFSRGIYAFDDWNAFAAGQPSAYQQQFGSTVRGHRLWNHYYFAQDDWKARRGLTINLGVRVEAVRGVTEVNNLTSNLNLDCRQPMGAAGTGPLGCFTTGGPANPSVVNWAPRVGFAWSPRRNERTVVRGGYGAAYDFNFTNPITNQRALLPYVATASLNGRQSFTGANSWANLLAGAAAAQRDARASLGVLDPTRLNYGNVSPVIAGNLRNPRVHQWSLGVQREVWGRMVLKAAYVGTKANFLQRSRQINLIADPRARAAVSLEDETARLRDFQAALAASNGSARALSNRADPRFNQVTYYDNSANSNYHAFEFLASRPFRAGNSLQVAYTRAKSIDDASDGLGNLPNDHSLAQNPGNLRDNRGVSAFDLPHRLVIVHIWEPPWGRGPRNGWRKRAFDGWGFAGITSFRSGFPLTFESGGRRGIAASSLVGSPGGTVRPNAAGPVSFEPQPFGGAGAPIGLNNDPLQRVSAYAAAIGLAQPLIGNFGNIGRNVHRVNGQRNFDWSVYKTTRLTERASVQIRGEFYNIFNHHMFQDVSRNITSPTFGQYVSLGQIPRLVQIGARVVF